MLKNINYQNKLYNTRDNDNVQSYDKLNHNYLIFSNIFTLKHVKIILTKSKVHKKKQNKIATLKIKKI